MARGETRAAGDVAGGGVGRGHKRPGAVVNIQQRALRALKQNVGAGAAQFGEAFVHRAHHLHQRVAVRQDKVKVGAPVPGFGAVIALQQKVVVLRQRLQFAGEAVGVGDIGQPQRAPRRLVFVGRADALAGRADGAAAARGLARDVKQPVALKQQRARARQPQPRGDFAAAAAERPNLVKQRARRQHDAVAYQTLHTGPDRARRQQVQYLRLAVDDDGVAGVVPALKANDGVGVGGQAIHYLALALVAPLQANHGGGCHLNAAVMMVP